MESRARGQRAAGASSLLAGVALAAVLRGTWRSAFVAAPPASQLPRSLAGVKLASAVSAPEAPTSSAWPVALPALAALGALAAKRSTRQSEGAVASNFVGPISVPTRSEKEPATVMHGGRRERLGVPGNTCMLTGEHRVKVETRSYSEVRSKHWKNPNMHWKRLWWAREQKFVRLYITDKAIHLVDEFGLEEMARRAGLDLYAWCKPHWMPGSRQPLCLKVGCTDKAKNDLKLWRDYEDKLNKGAALADICPAPKRRSGKAKPMSMLKKTQRAKGVRLQTSPR